MSKFNELLIGLVLEGFLYGLYSGIFAMYLQIQASKKDTNKLQTIIFYSICALYALSVAVFVCDIMLPIYRFLGKPQGSALHLVFTQLISFGFCDFISQFILIYRCWIMWACKFRVVVVPALLAFGFLGLWLTSIGSVYLSSNQIEGHSWANVLTPMTIALSLSVNALVTALIVFRIFRVFREVKATSDDKILGVTGGEKLRRVILVLIESGMALFSIQLALFVITVMPKGPGVKAIAVISSIYDMITGLTPTIILVRTSMGLSFHDEKSMEEVAIGSLHFASDHPDLVPETRSTSIVGQDSRDDDNISDVEQSNDIDINVVNR